jgi:cellulose synthase/poly-beta-1,6-N-acetylglucosamine synthase-like glycosyltransferase
MTAPAAWLVFWSAAVALAYAYLGYPVLLWCAARRRRPRVQAAVPPPSVTVIVAAHDEERCIEPKVRSVLAQDDPPLRLDCIVVSDGSTDATDQRVQAIADARVRLVRQPRAGKNAALSRGVREARGEVVVFTDADALLEPGALAWLLAPFADLSVGLVSGRGLYRGAQGAAVANAYVRYETLLKQLESQLGFVAYADGALYAMRTALFRELPPDQVHDLLHPIEVCLAGSRSVFEPRAQTVEPGCAGWRDEYGRQVRMAAQGMRVLARQLGPLSRTGKAWPVLVLVSHRALRWCVVPLLLSVGLATLVLARESGLFLALAAGQAAFYALAAAGALAEKARGLSLPRLAFMFCVVGVAAMEALVQVVRGRAFTLWPRTRTGEAA